MLQFTGAAQTQASPVAIHAGHSCQPHIGMTWGLRKRLHLDRIAGEPRGGTHRAGVLTTLVGTALPGALPDLVAGYSFLQTAVLVVIGQSIYEELLFRCVLQGLLTPALSWCSRFLEHDLTLGAIIGAVVFGLTHLILLGPGGEVAPVLAVVIAAILLGLVAGYHRDRTGGMVNPILVHMGANLGDYLAEHFV